jgi:hypothetical protein
MYKHFGRPWARFSEKKLSMIFPEFSVSKKILFIFTIICTTRILLVLYQMDTFCTYILKDFGEAVVLYLYGTLCLEKLTKAHEYCRIVCVRAGFWCRDLPNTKVDY